MLYLLSLMALLFSFFFICYFCFDLLSLSLPFVCAATIVHNDGDPVGDGSSYPEGARGQAQARDTPMMLATSTVAFSRVESNRIESNRIESNRIGSNRTASSPGQSRRHYEEKRPKPAF